MKAKCTLLVSAVALNFIIGGRAQFVAESPQPNGLPTLTNQFPLPIYLANYRANNVVVDWNSAIQWILFASNATNTAPRLFAFTHIVMWDAWKANNASANPADPAAVTSFAAMLAMKNLVPLYYEKYDELVRKHTANLNDSQISAAENMAKAPVANFLYSRLVDGFQDPNSVISATGGPGQYVDTGLDLVKPVQQYSHTKSLVLPENLTQVDVIANFKPPPAVGSSDYINQYGSVYLYGSQNSTLRSLSQTNTALFWGDQTASLTNVLAQWNRLVIGTLPSNVSLEVTVALLAEYNAGMYDCVTSTFFMKYKFFQWRPVTAIRSGDSDHDPDPDWTPLLPTPGYPGYPAFGGCYAGFTQSYMTNFYGTDKRTFVVTTTSVDQNENLLPTRQYISFSQVAQEVLQSRYFGGIEYPTDSASAAPLGDAIASYFKNGLYAWDPVYQRPPSSIDMSG